MNKQTTADVEAAAMAARRKLPPTTEEQIAINTHGTKVACIWIAIFTGFLALVVLAGIILGAQALIDSSNTGGGSSVSCSIDNPNWPDC